MNANQTPDQQLNPVDGNVFDSETLPVLVQRDPELPNGTGELVMDSGSTGLELITSKLDTRIASLLINKRLLRVVGYEFSDECPDDEKYHCRAFNAKSNQRLAFTSLTSDCVIDIPPHHFINALGQTLPFYLGEYGEVLHSGVQVYWAGFDPQDAILRMQPDDELKSRGFPIGWVTKEKSDKSFEINSKMVCGKQIAFSGPSIHKCAVFNNGDTVLVFSTNIINSGQPSQAFVRLQPGEYMTNHGQIRKFIDTTKLPRAFDSESGLPIEYHGFDPAEHSLTSEVPNMERNTNLCQLLNGSRAPRFEKDGEPCIAYNILLGENIVFTDLTTKEQHVIPNEHYLNTQGEVQRLVINGGFAYDYSNGNPLKFIGHLNQTQTLAIAKKTAPDRPMMLNYSERIAQRYVKCGLVFRNRNEPVTMVDFFRYLSCNRNTVISKWQMELLDAGKTLCCMTDRGLMPFQKQDDDTIALREWQTSDIEMFLEFLPVFYYRQINIDALNQTIKNANMVEKVFVNILTCPTYQQLISWLNNPESPMFTPDGGFDPNDLEPIVIHPGRSGNADIAPLPSTVPGFHPTPMFNPHQPMPHPPVYPTPYNNAGSFANHFGTFAQAHPGMMPQMAQSAMMPQYHATPDERTYGASTKMFRPL